MNGFEYSAAIHMIMNGLVDEGMTCVAAIRHRYDGERRNHVHLLPDRMLEIEWSHDLDRIPNHDRSARQMRGYARAGDGGVGALSRKLCVCRLRT